MSAVRQKQYSRRSNNARGKDQVSRYGENCSKISKNCNSENKCVGVLGYEYHLQVKKML